MKFILAEKKVDKAIDACIDLQYDYYNEIEAAECQYDLGRVLDMLTHISASLQSLQ